MFVTGFTAFQNIAGAAGLRTPFTAAAASAPACSTGRSTACTILAQSTFTLWAGYPTTKEDIVHVVKGINSVINGPHCKNHLIPCAHWKVAVVSNFHWRLRTIPLNGAERFEIKRRTREWSAWIPILLGEEILPARGTVVCCKLPGERKLTRLDISFVPTRGILLVELLESIVSRRRKLPIRRSSIGKPLGGLETLRLILD